VVVGANLLKKDLSCDHHSSIGLKSGEYGDKQKVQALYLLKSGLSQSITNVAEVLGVHRITVQRWFKQYSEEGLSSLLKLGKSTGRPRAISSEIIAGISTKINAESANLRAIKKLPDG
jgi:transposase